MANRFQRNEVANKIDEVGSIDFNEARKLINFNNVTTVNIHIHGDSENANDIQRTDSMSIRSFSLRTKPLHINALSRVSAGRTFYNLLTALFRLLRSWLLG